MKKVVFSLVFCIVFICLFSCQFSIVDLAAGCRQIDEFTIEGPKGSLVQAKYIGVLRMLDDNEVDDKIVGVIDGTALYQVNNLEELNDTFPGASLIIETWFANYKGPGEVKVLGWKGVESAKKIIEDAVEAAIQN